MRKKRSASGWSAFMRWYCCMAGVRAALVATDMAKKRLAYPSGRPGQGVSAKENFRVRELLEVHLLRPRGGLAQRNGVDARAVQRHHVAEAALAHEVQGADAEAGADDAVERGGGAAALDVAQHRDPRLDPEALGDLLRDPEADAGAAPLADAGRRLLAGGEGALRDDHDRERAAAPVPAVEHLAHLVEP